MARLSISTSYPHFYFLPLFMATFSFLYQSQQNLLARVVGYYLQQNTYPHSNRFDIHSFGNMDYSLQAQKFSLVQSGYYLLCLQRPNQNSLELYKCTRMQEFTFGRLSARGWRQQSIRSCMSGQPSAPKRVISEAEPPYIRSILHQN